MEKPLKRIYIFDFLRGIAIFGVVLLHTMQHQWQNTAAVASGEQSTTPILRFLYYILTMAGLFYIVMGGVNGFMIYNRLVSAKNTPKQLMHSGFLMGVSLIILHYVFRLTVSADSGYFYFLIVGGKPDHSILYYLVVTSTLSMLGWTSIIVSSLVPLLIKMERVKASSSSGYKIDKQSAQIIYLKLGLFALTILITTPFIRYWLIPLVESSLNANHVFLSVLLGWLVYIRFPIFPYAAYGIIGAMLGIALARAESPRLIRRYLVLIGTLLMVIGFGGNYYYGGLEPIYYDDFSWKGILNITFMQYSQVGLFLVLIWIGLWFFDFVPPEIHKKRTRIFSGLRRFSMISLTIFLLESLITAIIVKIIDSLSLFPGWHQYLGVVALFGLLNILVWAFIAKKWEKYKYAGTIEWILIKLVEKSSGKKSEKYNLERLKIHIHPFHHKNKKA